MAKEDGINHGEIRHRGNGEFLPDGVSAGDGNLRGEAARADAEQIRQGAQLDAVPALIGGNQRAHQGADQRKIKHDAPGGFAGGAHFAQLQVGKPGRGGADETAGQSPRLAAVKTGAQQDGNARKTNYQHGDCAAGDALAQQQEGKERDENGGAVAEGNGGGQRQNSQRIELDEARACAGDTAHHMRAQQLGGKTLAAQQGVSAEGKDGGQVAPGGEFVRLVGEQTRAFFGKHAHQREIKSGEQRPEDAAGGRSEHRFDGNVGKARHYSAARE